MDAVADIALGPGGEELYVAGMVDGAARIVKIALDDDADHNDDEAVAPRRGKRDKSSAIGTASTTNMAKPFFDLSRKYTAKSSPPSDAVFSIVVDNGGNVYASYPGGVVVIASSGTEIASLALSSADTKSKNDKDKPTAAAIPTALEIGDDGYLYVSTSTSLMRIQSRIGPAVIGTDMVIPAKKKN